MVKRSNALQGNNIYLYISVTALAGKLYLVLGHNMRNSTFGDWLKDELNIRRVNNYYNFLIFQMTLSLG